MEWNEADGKCHIAQLPNEILTEVLQYLSTRQLLSCRTVSSRWNQLVSSVCRQRHVQLSKGPCGCSHKVLRPDTLCQPQWLVDATLAPWSAIELDFPLVTCRHEKVLTVIPSHLDTTLSLMTKFTATLAGGQDDVLFFRVLERMPSLQVLCINMPDDQECSHHPDFKAPDDMTLDLSTLKEVDIDCTTETACHLLEYILTRHKTSVRNVNLRRSPWVWVGTVFSRIWSLVKNIESVTLDVTYSAPTTFDWATLLVQPRPNLKRLVIRRSDLIDEDDDDWSEDDHLKVLEEVLGKCAPHLESLSLIHFHTVAAADLFRQRRAVFGHIVLEVPALPELRHLHICGDGSLRHFSPLHFPKLRSVHLQHDFVDNDHDWHWHRYHSEGDLDLAKAFGRHGAFSTVRSLELKGFHGRSANGRILRWGAATAFPELKELSVKVKDAYQLSAAFSAVIGLDLHRLTIDFEPDEDEDDEDENAVDLILYKGLRNVPPDMELRAVVVKTPPGRGLCDRSAILFNLLKPLHLVLWDARNLSESCLSKLRNYHTSVHLED